MKSMFLQQSYNDNIDSYNKSLSRSRFAKWDYIVLTASNESQAKAYREQLDYRIKGGYLSDDTKYAVIPDTDGKRVGSGGATLNVLEYIHQQENSADCFKGKRILVIHSGGDSKRVPQYSACGKLFAPVPHELPDGRRSTLFDEFIIGMSGVPSRLQDGMVVLSGDVLLMFNPLQIDFSGNGAACISFKEPVEIGKNHGVFLGNGNGYVSEFLHKQSVEQLTNKGAVNEKGNINIDTGAVIFSSEMLEDLYSLISVDGKSDKKLFDKFVSEETRLSFYADFLYPLAENSTLDEYYKQTPEGSFTEELKAARTDVWNAISKYSLKLLSLSPAEFIHFGTTKELLKLMTDDLTNYRYLDWKSQVKSTVYLDSESSFNNSYVQHDVEIGTGSYVEDSYLMSGTRVGSHCIISTSTLDGVTVEDNTVLHCLKQNDNSFVCRIYGIHDSPKDTLEGNGHYLGTSISEFMKTNGLSESDLWDNDEHYLWNAKLYAPQKSIKEAVNFALNISDMVHGKGNSQAFKNAKRVSLCESFNNADVVEILPWSAKLEDKICSQRFMKCVDMNTPVTEMTNFKLSRRCEKFILSDIEQSDFSRKIRGYYYLSKCSASHCEEYEELCFKTIENSIFDSCKSLIREKTGLEISRNSVEVQLPVRVNFGGGWSDTPPYCNEHGGTVLNAAIKIKGKMPVIVKIHKLDKNVIALASTDSGDYKEFTNCSDIQNCHDPYDAFALHKAALIAFGLIPRTEKTELADVLKKIGGGFYLSTEVCDIPRGSGLGTSSILAGAAIKALYEFFGIEPTDDELYSTVLVMEQIMSTGGGWQDQVGGLTGGIKLVTTRKGMVQKIKCTQVDTDTETLKELQDRFAIIYTGQRRLARNLLHEVVGKYLGARKNSVIALSEIQKNAVLMRFELERGNVDEFAKLMNEHWELSKMLDMGCTNTCIDQIFSSVEDMLDGKMICGAGGGGFLQVVLKKGVTKNQLHTRLTDIFQDSGVDVWDCEFV